MDYKISLAQQALEYNMSEDRNQAFDWNLVGDIALGRPTLGNSTRVELYRIFQYTVRDILETRFGNEIADKIMYEAGVLAGSNFCRQYCNTNLPLEKFLEELGKIMKEFGMGVLLVEGLAKAGEKLCMQISLAEDLDCSGLPPRGATICDYDEGFLAGLFRVYTGKEFKVKEVACWCTGEKTCRFEIMSI